MGKKNVAGSTTWTEINTAAIAFFLDETSAQAGMVSAEKKLT